MDRLVMLRCINTVLNETLLRSARWRRLASLLRGGQDAPEGFRLALLTRSSCTKLVRSVTLAIRRLLCHVLEVDLRRVH